MVISWTIEQLGAISDIDFVIRLLQEKQNKLTNPYSPLNAKIEKAKSTLEKFKDME